MEKKGISRNKVEKIVKGKKVFSWDYFDQKAKPIADEKIIDRCNKLVLPLPGPMSGYQQTQKVIYRLQEEMLKVVCSIATMKTEPGCRLR